MRLYEEILSARKGADFSVRLSNHISDILRIIAFPALAPALSMFSHTSPIHIESSPFGSPIAAIHHTFVNFSTLYFPSTKTPVSVDEPFKIRTPSMKLPDFVDETSKMIRLSTKTNLSVDGSGHLRSRPALWMRRLRRFRYIGPGYPCGNSSSRIARSSRSSRRSCWLEAL